MLAVGWLASEVVEDCRLQCIHLGIIRTSVYQMAQRLDKLQGTFAACESDSVTTGG